MPMTNLAHIEDRREVREEVHHRTRAIGADGLSVALLVVNLSPHGLMARCDVDLAEGSVLRLTLPHVGSVIAKVRWALGGRIGCQFDLPIARAPYYQLLAVLAK